MKQHTRIPALFTMVTVLFFLFGVLCSADGHNKEKTSKLRLVVTSKETSAPVDAAAVIVRVKNETFDELTSTNSQGVASMASVPHGTLVVQVVKTGLRIWGSEFEFKEDKTIQVVLEKEAPPPSPTPTP